MEKEPKPMVPCPCGCHITTPFTSDGNERPEGFVCLECSCLADQIIKELLEE